MELKIAYHYDYQQYDGAVHLLVLETDDSIDRLAPEQKNNNI